jgi:hypothetical protein
MGTLGSLRKSDDNTQENVSKAVEHFLIEE